MCIRDRRSGFQRVSGKLRGDDMITSPLLSWLPPLTQPQDILICGVILLLIIAGMVGMVIDSCN
jgi:hypothetical protein